MRADIPATELARPLAEVGNTATIFDLGDRSTASAAERLASTPSEIRDFGHVRAAAPEAAEQRDRLIAELERPGRATHGTASGMDTANSTQQEPQPARRPAA